MGSVAGNSFRTTVMDKQTSDMEADMDGWMFQQN